MSDRAAPKQGARTSGRRPPPWLVLSALAILVLLLLFGCIFVFPAYLVDRDLGGRAKRTLEPQELLKATNDIRATLLQGLAAGFFLATAFFTWRQLRVSQRQLKVSEDQQVAERFTRAVEQLSNDSLGVRLGGIYALERIAKDSERDFGVAAEVLTAFVRERAPWPPLAEPRPAEEIPPDIQAVLTVLGRRDEERSLAAPRLDLSATDLRGSDLRGANLQRVLLNKSSLAEAHVERAHLDNARLAEADLRKAHLDHAFLPGAVIVNALLQGTNLSESDLRAANLTAAKVDRNTRLVNTRLEGANLRWVELHKARYGGLSYDEHTEWPESFSPEAKATPDPAPE